MLAQELSRAIHGDGKSKGASPMFKVSLIHSVAFKWIFQVSMLLKEDQSGIIFSPTMPEVQRAIERPDCQCGVLLFGPSVYPIQPRNHEFVGVLSPSERCRLIKCVRALSAY